MKTTANTAANANANAFETAVKAVCSLTVDSGKVYPKAMAALAALAGGVKPPSVVATEVYEAAVEAAQAAARRMSKGDKGDKPLSVNELKSNFPALKGLRNWKGALSDCDNWAAFEAVSGLSYPQLLKSKTKNKTKGAGEAGEAPEGAPEGAGEVAPVELPIVATLSDLLAALETDADGVRLADRAGLASEIRALLATASKPKAARKTRAA